MKTSKSTPLPLIHSIRNVRKERERAQRLGDVLMGLNQPPIRVAPICHSVTPNAFVTEFS